MIGQHPQLVGLPELKLFGHRTIAELELSLPAYWRERGFTHRSPGLVRALAEFEFGGQTPKRIAAAREWLHARGHWSGANVLDVLLARLAPREAVEKSPENVTSAAALKRLAAAYPNARYLHLTRHPLTAQASAARHLRATVPEHPQAGEPMAGRMGGGAPTHPAFHGGASETARAQGSRRGRSQRPRRPAAPDRAVAGNSR